MLGGCHVSHDNSLAFSGPAPLGTIAFGSKNCLIIQLVYFPNLFKSILLCNHTSICYYCEYCVLIQCRMTAGRICLFFCWATKKRSLQTFMSYKDRYCAHFSGGEGGIRTHVPCHQDNSISSRARYGQLRYLSAHSELSWRQILNTCADNPEG